MPSASVDGNSIASEDSCVRCLCRPQAAKHHSYDSCRVVIALSHHDGTMKATVVHFWQKVVKSLRQGCYEDTAVWESSAQIPTQGKHKCFLNLQELGGRKQFGVSCCLPGRLTKVLQAACHKRKTETNAHTCTCMQWTHPHARTHAYLHLTCDMCPRTH